MVDFDALQNILDIPANNWQLQALVSTPTHLSVHKCGCTQDYGRTVEILYISKNKLLHTYLSKISRSEFSRIIIHISSLQILIPPVGCKSATFSSLVEPVRVVT